MDLIRNLRDALIGWLANIGVNLDCALASLVLFAPAKTTITQMAQAARLAGRRWGCVLCAVLDKVDKDHCDKYGRPDRLL